MRATNAAEFEETFPERFGRRAHPAADPSPSLRQAITEQLQGHRRDLRFDLRGLSEFEGAVWRKALEIPRAGRLSPGHRPL